MVSRNVITPRRVLTFGCRRATTSGCGRSIISGCCCSNGTGLTLLGSTTHTGRLFGEFVNTTGFLCELTSPTKLGRSFDGSGVWDPVPAGTVVSDVFGIAGGAAVSVLLGPALADVLGLAISTEAAGFLFVDLFALVLATMSVAGMFDAELVDAVGVTTVCVARRCSGRTAGVAAAFSRSAVDAFLPLVTCTIGFFKLTKPFRMRCFAVVVGLVVLAG